MKVMAATAVALLSQTLRAQRQLPDCERMTNALALLQSANSLSVDFVRAATEPGRSVPTLFALLVALGRGDLSVARLYEGHVNALQLVARLGTIEQVERVSKTAEAGGLIGIWGADDPAAPGHLEQARHAYRLAGRKTYASGADTVERALVAVKNADGQTQLVLLDRQDIAGRLDCDWWKPIGMQATNSFALNVDGLVVGEDQMVGPAGAYERQPFFGAGAIRFVAAQLGGTLALWDATRAHLLAAGRHDNPHQAARMGQIVAELEAVYALVQQAYRRAAPFIAWKAAPAKADGYLFADCARIAVEGAAERVMALAFRSVGCAGLMDSHPLAAAARDLLVYLRQPAPDAAVTRLGVGACTGEYQALFDGQ